MSPKKEDKLFQEIQKLIGEVVEVEEGRENIERLPSGFMVTDAAGETVNFDDLLGGGYPSGRVIEIFGPQTSGKTSIVTWFFSAILDQGKTCVLFDVESSYNLEFAAKQGLNVDKYLNKKFFIQQPELDDYAEKIMDKVVALCKSNKVDAIAIDSLASLIPKAEMEADIEKQDMAQLARAMGKALRKIVLAAGATNTTVIFLNQIREKVGSFSPTGKTPTDTPGGRALKFFASVRIEATEDGGKTKKTARPDFYDGKGQKIGHSIKLFVRKNKVGEPFGVGHADIFYCPQRKIINAIDAESRKEDGVVQVSPKNHKKVFIELNDEKYQVVLPEKKAWNFIVEWLRSNNLFFEFLERIDFDDFETLIKDEDLKAEEVAEYLESKKEVCDTVEKEEEKEAVEK